MAEISSSSLTIRTAHSASEQSATSPSRRCALATSDAGSTSSSIPSGPSSDGRSIAEKPAPSRTSATRDEAFARSK